MNTLLLALALAARAAAPVAPDVWVTIDRDVLVAFERAGNVWEPTALGGGVDLARPQVVATAIPESRIVELSTFIHERYERCGGFMAHGSREEALATASRMQYVSAIEQMPAPVPYTIDNRTVATALVAEVKEANIRQNIADLAAFFTRYHNCATGNQSALSIRDKWTAIAAGRSDVSVALFPHTTYTTMQPSVILTITGTTLPSEVVILGAHQDSIAGSNCTTSRAPGADDDASGVASITEILRTMMTLNFHPQRTVKFMAYAAEEIGLRGSNEIATAYQAQGVNVVGVLHFDMTNYAGTRGADIVIYTDFTNAAQNAFITELATQYVPTAFTAAPRLTDICGYGCSDHASWTAKGYPSSFPFETRFTQDNPFIHSANDTLANMGNTAAHSVPFAQLGAAYVAELAKGSFVPVAPAAPRAVVQRTRRN
jgi:leucyl aminopeptidase